MKMRSEGAKQTQSRSEAAPLLAACGTGTVDVGQKNFLAQLFKYRITCVPKKGPREDVNRESRKSRDFLGQ